MIDEARIVAIDTGIDHRPIARDEQEGVTVVIPFDFIATIGFGM